MIKSDPAYLLQTTIDRTNVFGTSSFPTGEHKYRGKAIISFKTINNFTVFCDWGMNSTLKYKWKLLRIKYV